MGNPIQYAQLPKFEYQTFERQYQTFDRHTLQFSFYPVASTSTDDLTPDNDQGNNPAEAGNVPEEGSSSSPTDTASCPEAAGKLVHKPSFTPLPCVVHDCGSPSSLPLYHYVVSNYCCLIVVSLLNICRIV